MKASLSIPILSQVRTRKDLGRVFSSFVVAMLGLFFALMEVDTCSMGRRATQSMTSAMIDAEEGLGSSCAINNREDPQDSSIECILYVRYTEAADALPSLEWSVD